MAKFAATNILATAASATLFAQPVQSATAVLQPHSILLDQVGQVSTEQVIPVGGGHGHWGGGGGMMWRHGGMGSWGGGWGNRGWWGHRRFVRRVWGWGGGWPAYGYGYAGDCPYGVWTYQWGCVPYGVYGGPGFGYGAPVVNFGIGFGGWGGGW